ncbi:unnamed protein product [Aphanomyces euteiches]
MSDEFEQPGRLFKAGHDHLWTALDLPDGVNAALGWYNSSNVYTTEGKLVIRVDEGPRNATYFNQWLDSPQYETRVLHYTAAMIQSWNKFCIQGGLIEVSVKLPGAVDSKSWNPHVQHKLNPKTVISNIRFYPTWPGIWLMGNLGRALFLGSTSRMWPWSFDECDPELAMHQRINACNSTPGYGLNPRQGRGAPEIDVLEGGGTAISSSIHVSPGMPDEFRRIPPNSKAPYWDSSFCFYNNNCRTPGANIADAPTDTFAHRGHPSWYQNLRYGSNDHCPSNADKIQSYDDVVAAKGKITANTYDKTQMSAAQDVHADLNWIDGKSSRKKRWGINVNGTCFAISNGYVGTFLCDPDSRNPKCAKPRLPTTPLTKQMAPFEYQMDAISANWDITFDAYTSFYRYSLEWVMGRQGYLRWMLEDAPVFEIPAESLENVPKSNTTRNPAKLMIEEPMYLIVNVAVARAWGATPPNANVGPCRGDGINPPRYSREWNFSNNICNSFPMFFQVDYIRIYQATTGMSVGCDPASHPTKAWIDGHIDLYTDFHNRDVTVAGGATCRIHNDCTTPMAPSGRCVSQRCVCAFGYTGPRCTKLSAVKLASPSPTLCAILTCACIILVMTTDLMRKRKMALARVETELYRGIQLNAIAMYDDFDDDDDVYTVDWEQMPQEF